MTKDNANITETQRVLDHLRREREEQVRLGSQGALILARKELPDTIVEEGQLTVEQTFIAYLQTVDQQVQNIMFLEEVYKSHIKLMKENDK